MPFSGLETKLSISQVGCPSTQEHPVSYTILLIAEKRRDGFKIFPKSFSTK